MKLRVLKAGEVVLDIEASQVTLPAVAGEMTAMDGHDRLFSLLSGGRISYLPAGSGERAMERMEISPGAAEVDHKSVTIFVEEAGREDSTSSDEAK